MGQCNLLGQYRYSLYFAVSYRCYYRSCRTSATKNPSARGIPFGVRVIERNNPVDTLLVDDDDNGMMGHSPCVMRLRHPHVYIMAHWHWQTKVPNGNMIRSTPVLQYADST